MLKCPSDMQDIKTVILDRFDLGSFLFKQDSFLSDTDFTQRVAKRLKTAIET